MADVITRLVVDSQDYDSKIKRAAQGLQHYADACKKAGGTLEFVDKEAMEFAKTIGKMSTASNSAREKMQEYNDAIIGLTATYRQMTEAEKNGAFGKAMAASIDELKAKAAQLKDVIADTTREMSGMSSDTKVFDSVTGGMQTMVAAFQLGQGALQMLGIENENTIEAMAKLQGAMAVTNSLSQLQTQFQKQSATMLGVAALQKKALAAAEALDTTAKTGNIVVTKAATAAQAALNAVAKANPYVLLVSAILAVGTALVAYAKKSKEAKKAEEERQKALEKAKEKEENYNSTIGNETGRLIATYQRLKVEWEALSTSQEKTDWIDKQQREFNNLGISVKNVVDAENVFVRNSDKMIKALDLRARASALEQLSVSEYEEYYRRLSEFGGLVRAGSAASLGDQTALNLYERTRVTHGYAYRPSNYDDFVYNSETGRHEYTAEGAERQNARVLAEAGMSDQTAFAFITQAQELRDECNAILAEIGVQPAGDSGGGGGSTPEIFPEGSIAHAEQQLRGLQEQWRKTASPETRAQLKTQIDELIVSIKEMKGEAENAGDSFEETFEVGSLKYLQGKLAAAKETLSGLSPESEKWASALADVTNWETQVAELMKQIKGETESVSIAVEELPSAFENFKDGVGSVNNMVSALDSLKTIGEDLTAVFNGEMDAWDSLMTVIGAGLGVLEAVITVTEAINTLSTIGIGIKKAKEAADKSSAATAVASAATEVAAEGSVTAASATATGVKAGEAAAGAGKAVSGIPFIGPALAVVAIGAVLAAVLTAVSKAKSAGSYADGGIIPGNSYSGDLQIANVNAGELILNRAQQQNLAGQLQSQGPIKLEAVVRGYDILLAATNYALATGKHAGVGFGGNSPGLPMIGG